MQVIRELWAGWRHPDRRRECPICGTVSALFGPVGQSNPLLTELQVVGGGRRLHVVCPRCCSTDRERLVYLYLRDQGWFQPRRERILHVGPERSLGAVLTRTAGLRYVSADLKLRRARLRADLTSLPFADRAFGLVICNHVLEHIPDEGKALAEIRRVLEPGGQAVLQVPISSALTHTREDPSITDAEGRHRTFGQADHVRLHARDYPDRLAAAGFSVTVLDPEETWGRETMRRYGLIRGERLHTVRIPPGQD